MDMSKKVWEGWVELLKLAEKVALDKEAQWFWR